MTWTLYLFLSPFRTLNRSLNFNDQLCFKISKITVALKNNDIQTWIFLSRWQKSQLFLRVVFFCLKRWICLISRVRFTRAFVQINRLQKMTLLRFLKREYYISFFFISRQILHPKWISSCLQETCFCNFHEKLFSGLDYFWILVENSHTSEVFSSLMV